eukprot:scaffold125788_cov72-Phaeocystis_antarctica.AAC.3
MGGPKPRTGNVPESGAQGVGDAVEARCRAGRGRGHPQLGRAVLGWASYCGGGDGSRRRRRRATAKTTRARIHNNTGTSKPIYPDAEGVWECSGRVRTLSGLCIPGELFHSFPSPGSRTSTNPALAHWPIAHGDDEHSSARNAC